MGFPRRLFLLLYAASGAAALVYEVAWTRLLTLQLGHTVAAASTVLAAFMGGLAVGAWIAGQSTYVRERHDAARLLRVYAALELVVAASAIALPFALGATTPALVWAYADGGAPARFAIVRVAIALALLGLPAAAMGATFPIATATFSTGGREPFSEIGKTLPDPLWKLGGMCWLAALSTPRTPPAPRLAPSPPGSFSSRRSACARRPASASRSTFSRLRARGESPPADPNPSSRPRPRNDRR